MLAPLWPLNDSTPAVTVRLQPLPPARRLLLAGHLRPDRRPAICRVNLKVTADGSFSENENVVPTGGRLLLWALIRASA